VRTLVQIVGQLNTLVAALEAELINIFEQHADADVVESLPGLGPVLGARAKADHTGFGHPPDRARARVARNRHLVNACFRWAYVSLRGSPSARSYCDAHRDRSQTDNQALGALANRIVGILHGCIAHARCTAKISFGSAFCHSRIDDLALWDVYRNQLSEPTNFTGDLQRSSLWRQRRRHSLDLRYRPHRHTTHPRKRTE
jgi:hypothetical protein